MDFEKVSKQKYCSFFSISACIALFFKGTFSHTALHSFLPNQLVDIVLAFEVCMYNSMELIASV